MGFPCDVVVRVRAAPCVEVSGQRASSSCEPRLRSVGPRGRAGRQEGARHPSGPTCRCVGSVRETDEQSGGWMLHCVANPTKHPSRSRHRTVATWTEGSNGVNSSSLARTRAARTGVSRNGELPANWRRIVGRVPARRVLARSSGALSSRETPNVPTVVTTSTDVSGPARAAAVARTSSDVQGGRR